LCSGASTQCLAADKNKAVVDWFAKYDEIRHAAQMSETERERSKRLMAEGLAASVFGSASAQADKAAGIDLLRRMVERYNRALSDLRGLAGPTPTKRLQKGYQQYFSDAGALFGDYLKVQTNILATDGKGNPILGQLQQRKSDLETLDAANKDLDSRL